MPDVSWHDILSAEKGRPVVPKDRPPSRLQSSDPPKVNRRTSKIDLSDSNLEQILRGKSRAKHCTDRLNVVEDDLFDFYSVQFVSNLSSNLAEEILKSICNEFVNSDLISNLIAAELKA